jgi:pimeloyl-ACP methyl ester carboxylesterase
LVRRPAHGPGTASAWLALPKHPDPSAIPLVAVHGIQRGARSQAALFAEEAAKAGRVVIAPCFSSKRFPGYQRVIMPQRADLALLELLDRIGREGMCDTSRVALFGYSGGAQFAHRFALFYPHRIASLSVLSAGWYTFPDDAPYPYGLASPKRRETPWLSSMASGLDRFLELPITALVGALDCTPDSNTRSNRRVDSQQGTHRLERCTRWHKALVAAADARGIQPRSTLHILPDCGHDFTECVRQGGAARLVLRGVPGAEHLSRGAVCSASSAA